MHNHKNPFEEIVKYQEKSKIEKDLIIKELIGKIHELIHSANSIGKGATAEVFASKTSPGVCYKIIRNNSECRFRHSAHDEGSLLAKAKEISKQSGVKVPIPYYSIVTKNIDGKEFEVLVMERLNSASIKEILSNELDVPENFDFKKFSSEIEKFFLKLHEQGIYHRDAHGGNIMIENETGAPCIIDFGGSILNELSAEDPYQQTDFQGKTMIMPNDDKSIRHELSVNLRGYLFKKYGNKHNL
jgi:tRNA A-37 threonylcarbamoyl transferase component Bud32